MTTCKVSDLVVEFLEKVGIQDAFSVTGGAAMHLNHSFGESKKISTTYFHHEQACAMAADGYARINNFPAVVVVTAGPGAINSLNGVFGAFTDSLPMLVLSGQSRTDTLLTNHHLGKLRQLGDQEVNSMSLVKSITKWQYQLTNPKNTIRALDQAWQIATTGRPGPVWFEIPIDIQGKSIAKKDLLKPQKSVGLKIKPPASNSLDRIVQKLQQSQKPLILAGSGVRIENQIDNLRSLIEKYRIPIATAWTHDLIESDHPLFAGRPGTIGTRPGNFVLQNCDLLIVLGSRLNIRQVSYNWNDFAKKAFKIWVDIDKEELKKPFPKMDLKINSPVGLFIKSLESKLNKSNTSLQNDKWLDWIKNINSKYGVDKENFVNETNRINPYELIPKIIDKAANDAIFVCGNATACIVPFQTAKLKREQRLFSNSGSASMGYDLPAAIGASIANPDKQVICFAGDGSLMMNIQELQTLKKLNCNVKVIVLDNDGYMSIKQTQNNFFGQKYGADSQSNLSFPNFSKIASAFELPSTLIDGISWDLQISEFLSTTGPGVLVAQISKNQEFTPRLKSKMSNSGMISPSLDDMFPHLSDTELHVIRTSSDNWAHESN